MHPRILSRVFNVFGAIGAIAVIGYFITSCTNWLQVSFIVFWGIGMVFMFLPWLLIYVIPVRCPRPGCNAPMRRDWFKEDRFTSHLRYRCTACGEVYDMKMTSEWGGGPY